MSENSPYSRLTAKASLELLLVTLCTMFHPEIVKKPDEEDQEHQATVRHLINYMEEHYNEKISLEDLARFSQYNRTYVSTLFKNTIGINFYEYLTRIRFQKALLELSSTSKSLSRLGCYCWYSIFPPNLKCHSFHKKASPAPPASSPARFHQ